MMEQQIHGLLLTMALNRHRHDGIWKKVREDRLEKLVSLPPELSMEDFLAAFLADPRVKRNHMLDDDEPELVPTVQLRFKTYQQLIRRSP